MTTEELIQKLKKLKDMNDFDLAVMEADELLLEYINNDDVRREYLELTRWYA